MDEATIDRALRDALRKADPGPYPKRIPYAATLREFLPDPVTALRWATYTAAGTVVLGGAALIVKAMGIHQQAPPLAVVEAPQAASPEIPAASLVVPPPPRTTPEKAVPAKAPTAISVTQVVVVPPSEPEPAVLVSEDVDKVSVVPAAYEPRHAQPDLGLNLLGMRLAVDLS